MSTLLKATITALAVLILLSLGIGVYKAVAGGYMVHASFITIGLMAVGIVVAAALAILGLNKLWNSRNAAAIAALTICLQGCNYAKSNQQVVVSTDCGMTWDKIKAGDAIPKGVGNACYMKVVMPNYPMQGDSRFITNLKDRVRANVHIDYDYSIIEPLSFIRQAKYLGKANASADSEDALDNTAFEGAENMVIDKRIRDISKSMFLQEDIVELDQADLENKLLTESNRVLEPLGVHLNFITLTFDLDDQTRQAIDISTAMKIYESKGLTELGKQVMAARAGATKISIETPGARPVESKTE